MTGAFSVPEAFERRARSGVPFSWRDSGLIGDAVRSLRSYCCSGAKNRESQDSMIRLSESVADACEQMGRMSLAAECRTFHIRLLSENLTLFGDDSEQMAGPLCKAIRARNYYADDNCPDLMALAEPYLGDAAEEVFAFAVSPRRVLRVDPSESSDAYLAVIDEVEKILEEEQPAEPWKRKKELLSERGVRWRSPAEMNPNILFTEQTI